MHEIWKTWNCCLEFFLSLNRRLCKFLKKYMHVWKSRNDDSMNLTISVWKMNEKVVHSSNSIIGIGSGKQNNNKIVINGLIDAYILITNKAIDTWQMFHSFHFLVFPFGTGVNNKLRIHHIYTHNIHKQATNDNIRSIFVEYFPTQRTNKIFSL